MKKWKIIIPCTLLAVLAIVGWRNRQAGRPAASADPQATSAAVLASSPTEGTAAGTGTPAETTAAGETYVTRSYPEQGVEMDAICPAQADALPVLTAQISNTYFQKMVQELLLARYPESVKREDEYYNDETGNEEWQYFAEDGTAYAWLSLFEAGTIDFDDRAIDRTLTVDEASGSSAAGSAGTEEEAIQAAIQALGSYTDFDLSAGSAERGEQDNGDVHYSLALRLSYKGTPIAEMSQAHRIVCDVGVWGNQVGCFQGTFSFDGITEEEKIPVISLDDAVDAFVNQAGTLTYGGQYSLEVSRIALEYTGQVGEGGRSYTFRPVWTFYYDTVQSDFRFQNSAKLYADTGELCTDGGTYEGA